MVFRGAVEPRPIAESGSPRSMPVFSGKAIGWTVGLVSYVVAVGIMSSTDFTTGQENVSLLAAGRSVALLYGVLFGIPLVLGLVAARLHRDQQRREWWSREIESMRDNALLEARQTTERMQDLQQEADRTATHLPRFLADVANELNSAERDFADRAFAPFWDRIAATASLLATYDLAIRHLSSLGDRYTHELTGRVHSFPPRLCIPQRIPRPTKCIAQLQRLVRQGQTDFHFAVIWEHHKTRRVLVEGFGTLEATLGHLENAIQASLTECTAAIVAGLSEMSGDVRTSTASAAEVILEKLDVIEEERWRSR